jgi:hypothetical protein
VTARHTQGTGEKLLCLENREERLPIPVSKMCITFAEALKRVCYQTEDIRRIVDRFSFDFQYSSNSGRFATLRENGFSKSKLTVACKVVYLRRKSKDSIPSRFISL